MTRFECGADAIGPLCGYTANLRPDLILLDLNTPRSDGFEIPKVFKSAPRLAHVPIAILTSSGNLADKKRAALQGARFIEKPSQREEFLSSVGGAVKEMLATSSVSHA